MDTQLLIIGVGGVLVNALVLYVVISAATKATERAKYEWAQLDLLAKIAKQQGVPDDEILKTLNAIQ